MKLVIFLYLIFVITNIRNEAFPTCADDEIPAWLELVDIPDGCTAGKIFKYQCRKCTCKEIGKSALCPKYIQCCKQGEIWSTNNCNHCMCDKDFNRICTAIIPCKRN